MANSSCGLFTETHTRLYVEQSKWKSRKSKKYRDPSVCGSKHNIHQRVPEALTQCATSGNVSERSKLWQNYLH
jgi:hypothetical protein